MPLVSVIIPAFNRSAALTLAVESVFAQSLQDLEIIIVDDGSTDDTRERMAAYGSRLVYLRQENAGASAARNLGILAARGEFIAFLDSDDMFLPGHLEESVSFLKEDARIQYAFGDIEKFDSGGVVMASFFKGKAIESIPYETGVRDRRVFKRSIAPELIAGNFITTSTLVLRREVFDRIGLFNPEYRFLNDAEMCLRLARAFTGGYFSKVKARMHVGEDNLTHRKWTEPRARLKLRLLRDLCAEEELDPALRARCQRQMGVVHFDLAYALYQTGQHKEARAQAMAALGKNPLRVKAYKLLLLSLLPGSAVAKE